jgi:hypothetical protein
MSTSSGMVSFEDDRLGSASDELQALCEECQLEFLVFMQKVYGRSVDHKRLKVFHSYQEVNFFHAKIDDCIMVFAVEDDGTDLKLTLMFAGTHGQAVHGTKWFWDGLDYHAFRTRVLDQRAAVWFV